MSHPSSSIPLFTQLVHRLRQTNARYDQIAYQCRRTQRLTYHAKRRAYRVGLRIDTSKAHAEWLDYLSAASTQLLPVLDRSSGSPVGVATGTETEGDHSDLESIAEDECLPNPWPEPEPKRLPHVIVQKPVTRLSPLGLGLSSIFDDSPDTCDLLVPGAPRWRSRPLPEDTEAMTNRSVSFKASCTYDRGVIATHVSDSVSKPLDLMYGCLGMTLPPRHLKRKLRDVEADWSTVFSRRPGVGVPDDGCFLGAWLEAQRRRVAL